MCSAAPSVGHLHVSLRGPPADPRKRARSWFTLVQCVGCRALTDLRTRDSYKDDSRILSTNDRLKVNNEQSDAGYYELVIPEVKPEDAGKYSCVAINSYGEERCDAQLTVVGKPSGNRERSAMPAARRLPVHSLTPVSQTTRTFSLAWRRRKRSSSPASSPRSTGRATARPSTRRSGSKCCSRYANPPTPVSAPRTTDWFLPARTQLG